MLVATVIGPIVEPGSMASTPTLIMRDPPDFSAIDWA